MQIDVLSSGYVRLVDHMGDDLSACRAARASFAKDAPEMNEKEERLIAFLIRENHMSCFRHATVTLQFKTPLFVARQHFKYQVASAFVEDQNGWNESSRRYITQEPEFHIPNNTEWRGAPENKKQGSGAPMDPRIGDVATKELEAYVAEGERLYNYWMDIGVAAEQARLFLPAYGMFVNYQWTTSLAQIIHFLKERLAHDAQYEMQQVAKAVYELTKPLFPVTFKALNLEGEL